VQMFVLLRHSQYVMKFGIDYDSNKKKYLDTCVYFFLDQTHVILM
jgi:hypothetical protein